MKNSSIIPGKILTYLSGVSSRVCLHTSPKLSRIRCSRSFLQEPVKHIDGPSAPPLLSSSIIIQPCLPPAVKTAQDNSLRQCQLNSNILPATIMSTGLETQGNKHMAPCSHTASCIHDFATAIPIFLLPEAIRC